MVLDEHGLEVIRKSGKEVTPGDRTNLMLQTKSIPSDFEPPLDAQLIGFEDSVQAPYYLTTVRYYNGGNPSSPGSLITSRTFYYTNSARCDIAWVKVGEP